MPLTPPPSLLLDCIHVPSSCLNVILVVAGFHLPSPPRLSSPVPCLSGVTKPVVVVEFVTLATVHMPVLPDSLSVFLGWMDKTRTQKLMGKVEQTTAPLHQTCLGLRGEARQGGDRETRSFLRLPRRSRTEASQGQGSSKHVEGEPPDLPLLSTLSSENTTRPPRFSNKILSLSQLLFRCTQGS